MIALIVKGLVIGNLVVLNLFAYLGYRAFSTRLSLVKSQLSLQVEERLAEEFEYVENTLGQFKGEILDTNQKLLPRTIKVRTSLPIIR